MSFELKIRARSRLADKIKMAYYSDQLWSAVAFKVGHRVAGVIKKVSPMFDNKSETEIIDMVCTWSNDELKDIMSDFEEPKGWVLNVKI